MLDVVEIWEKPQAKEINMLAGWRQWADAGSISSGLPRYLIEYLGAKQIGRIRPDGFYLFQFPGTHDLVRPVVRFKEGFPVALETPDNEIWYAGDEERGLVIFVGDEPHLNAEQYVAAVLEAADLLGVGRIIGLGGVYGELPYDKERLVSSIYSMESLREELEQLSVSLSDYQGGASIGSYVCRRAGESGKAYVSFYAFVPMYDFSEVAKVGNTIRLENDYMAWLGVLRRINHMLKLDLDLSELSHKSERLRQAVDKRIRELDEANPQLGLREYMDRLSEEFEEIVFEPLDEVWEEEFRRLFEDGEDS